ncbi:hypothetical protein PPACK8108_LOCUS7971 [Phakopsora pachyrhizi]|uniref:Uncharacterized protein n=1 Tax=Phakopsora pachyrhizi TaxID=170000 RepID=A0AAV0AYD0_PHAPC|nr:hypothetical protein PPACK8108_LOCUS7971 [Phakopsora pachyrhizi]
MPRTTLQIDKNDFTWIDFVSEFVAPVESQSKSKGLLSLAQEIDRANLEEGGDYLLYGALRSNLPQSIGRQYELQMKHRTLDVKELAKFSLALVVVLVEPGDGQLERTSDQRKKNRVDWKGKLEKKGDQ